MQRLISDMLKTDYFREILKEELKKVEEKFQEIIIQKSKVVASEINKNLKNNCNKTS